MQAQREKRNELQYRNNDLSSCRAAVALLYGLHHRTAARNTGRMKRAENHDITSTMAIQHDSFLELPQSFYFTNKAQLNPCGHASISGPWWYSLDLPWFDSGCDRPASVSWHFLTTLLHWLVNCIGTQTKCSKQFAHGLYRPSFHFLRASGFRFVGWFVRWALFLNMAINLSERSLEIFPAILSAYQYTQAMSILGNIFFPLVLWPPLAAAIGTIGRASENQGRAFNGG